MLDDLKNRFLYRQKPAWHKLAASHFEPDAIVLDLGCGCGDFLEYAPKNSIGLDWSQDNLREAKKMGKKLMRGDARAIELPDASVDGIHCSHLIEHFLPEDVHKVLKEMDRVLKPGGTIVLRSPMPWDGFYCDLTHIRPYPPESIMHYMVLDTRQRTLAAINGRYQKLHLRFRYANLNFGSKYLGAIFGQLNRFGFPWLTCTGYMLVLRKLVS